MPDETSSVIIASGSEDTAYGVIYWAAEEWLIDFTVFPSRHVRPDEWELSGRLRWDGCINFETNGHMHACSLEMSQQIFYDIYRLAEQAIPNWEG